jgi:tRNA nucleotidyltransferase (CCA-adding enzyme)
MRLARFVGELAFKPTKNVLNQALKFSKNINDISPERIKDELNKILVADTKYPFTSKDGHYNALKVLEAIGVLKIILPEIALGKGLKQRSDFHLYDVLEHTFRAVRYSKPSIRLSALLHDVGKPKNFLETGKYHGHDASGEVLTKRILSRLKYDNYTIKKTAFLVKWHMYDMECKTKENKVKLFIVMNREHVDDLLLLKQADYSACKDDFSTCATVLRWRDILRKMEEEKVPFSLKELNLTANDLIALGYKGADIGKTLDFILKTVICQPELNERDKLLKIVKSKP